MPQDPQLLTPTRIAAVLDCSHVVTLDRSVAAGELEAPRPTMGSFAQLLLDKGNEHEAACLADYRARGVEVVEVPARAPRESFAVWVERVGHLLHEGHEVLFQMPFVHDGVRGIADFLERKELPAGGFTYEPVDAKLARSEASASHVLQLCFYADAIEAALGVGPDQVHVWLGSGRFESVRRAEVGAVWRRLRARLTAVLADDEPAPTSPEPCSHCDFCLYLPTCDAAWRDAGALHLVAGMPPPHRTAATDAGLSDIWSLAASVEPVAGLDEKVSERHQRQAKLQLARVEGAPPPVHVLAPGDPGERWGRGLELLPEPDEGDVVLDFEGHPVWSPEAGLFFLFGFIERHAGGWRFVGRWAHDRDEERDAVVWLLDELVARRQRHPSMHVLHYNHTERSSLERLCDDHGIDRTALDILVREGTFVDLLEVVRNTVQIGAESYGLKQVEQAAGYERAHDIDKGAGAVLAYESFCARVAMEDRAGHDHTTDVDLAAIAAYNEDDVRATLAVRDWLVAFRAYNTPWRDAIINPDVDDLEPDPLVEGLRGLGTDADTLLADLLGYWRREDRAHNAQLLAAASRDVEDQLRDEDALGALTVVDISTDEQDRTLATATFPAQVHTLRVGSRVAWITLDGRPSYASVVVLVPTARRVQLLVQPDRETGVADTAPTAIVQFDHVGAKPKPDRLRKYADSALAAGGVAHLDDARARLLQRAPTRLSDGTSPTTFPADVDDQAEVATRLDRSHLAVQGPPGTGKTWRGARIIRRLLQDGKRVGITAFSHAAVLNLVRAVQELYVEQGDLDQLAAVVKSPWPHGLDGIEHTKGNGKATNKRYQLAAGTTWLFANQKMQDNPVDVLVVDEAGQLGLADTLAAASSASEIILLGDPQQLPQVTLASHPGGAGASVLEHLLDGEKTLARDQGIFLPDTRRMHPAVTELISSQFYDGRLQSHPSCAKQDTELGVGPRWVEVAHEGCSTSSQTEAEEVARLVGDVLGRAWTDAAGTTLTIGPDDVLVVTPYNAQRRLLEATLGADPATSDIRVGTVDKFQGQEAAVVVFSAAASTATDAARGVGFVFDRNRFNVAISRARCLAFLVCTSRLLDAVPGSVDGLRVMAPACVLAETPS